MPPVVHLSTDSGGAARPTPAGRPEGRFPRTLELLLFSDQRGQAEEIQAWLSRGGIEASCRQLPTFKGGVSAVLRMRPDAVLTRWRCGGGRCLRLIASLRSKGGSPVPVILLDATIGEAATEMAIRAGATAFADSRHPGRLASILRKAVTRAPRQHGEAAPWSGYEEDAEGDQSGLFRMLLDSSPAFIAYVNSMERYVWVNQKYSAWFGLPQKSILGKTVRELHGETAYAGQIGHYAKRALQGHVSRYNTRMHAAGGGWRHLDVNCIPNRSPDGAVLGYTVLAVDITEQREMAEAVERSRQRYKNLFESASHAILILTAPGPDAARIVAFNSEAARLLGAGVETMRGRALRELAGPGLEAEWEGLQHLAEDQSIRFEPEFTLKDQRTMQVEIDAKHLVVGSEHYVLAFLRDITQQRCAQAALAASETSMRLALEAGRMGTWAWDITTNTSVCSLELSRILGFGESEHQCSLDELLAIIHPEDRQVLLGMFRNPSLPEKEVDAEVRILRPDGQIRWVSQRARLWRDEQGRPTRILGIGHDITDRKTAEFRLREGKARLRQLLDGLFAFVASFDSEGRVVDVNRACREALGLPQEEIVGRHVWELPCWRDPVRAREDLQERFQAALQGRPLRFEINVRLASGRCAILDTQMGLLEGDDGEIQRVLGFAVDITRRRQAEEALRLSEQRLSLLAESIPQVFWIRSPDGSRIDYVSPACAGVWGRSPGELRAEPGSMTEAIHPGDRDNLQASLAANSRGEATDIEYRLLRADGTTRWIRDRAIPIRGPEGALACICGVAEDFTDRRAMERRVRETERLAATGRMAARVAHEINNPLGGIRNAVYLLKDAVRHKHPAAQYLPMIEMELDRISRIVAQMFDLYQPRHQPARVIQVANLVARVVELCQPKARAAGVELRFTGGLPPETAVFEGPIAQILFNLINNAIDASPPRGTVTVDLEVTRDGLGLSIADEGPGVAQHLRDRIFEPFFTTKEGSPGKGLGLGLSVSRSLAESMGGRLEVMDNGAPGAIFRLRLPPQSTSPAAPDASPAGPHRPGEQPDPNRP